LLETELMRGSPRAQNQRIQRMLLHALDAWVRDATVLTDVEQVQAALYAGAESGGATVVGESFAVFPNGAVTGVLVLAQSHLSIHTWPEFALANVDLLSYGEVRGDEVLRVICERLGSERSQLTRIRRAVGWRAPL
jgi:S-adenosylmethionine decarboxylase